MEKSKFPRFNDGVAYVYAEATKRSTFGAKENTREVEESDLICKLDFEQMSKREQDQEFANQNGYSLSMKIRTRYVEAVKSHCKVVIENTLYDIFDIDKTRTEQYLYLEEVRKIAT